MALIFIMVVYITGWKQISSFPMRLVPLAIRVGVLPVCGLPHPGPLHIYYDSLQGTQTILCHLNQHRCMVHHYGSVQNRSRFIIGCLDLPRYLLCLRFSSQKL